MTQPEQAVGGEANHEPADARDTFEAMADEWLGDTDEQPEEAEPEEAEGDEPEAAEDGEESDDEPEIEAEDDDLPPIDAPVSWDAEAKEAFKNLPRELQETVTKREAERERFVQSKSQEAARAKQEAVQTAHSQLAELEQAYAAQYEQVAQQIAPQRPNPALLQHDPQAFYAQQAQYEAAVAQQSDLQQQAQHYAQQAQARLAQVEQAHHAEQQQKLVETFPEYLDPTTGPDLQRRLSEVARELGYSPELISQARADDILAMKTAADWKAKAQKYDALQAKKMEKVRAAKGLPRVATPGVSAGPEATRKARSQAAWERTKAASSSNERADAFADYLKSTGQL